MVGVVVVLIIGGCAGDDGDVATPEATSTSPIPVDRSYPEDIATACAAHDAAFEDLIADFSITDAQHADRLQSIADTEAAGGRLEPLLRDLADAYRRGDASIPDTIGPECRGETPTTLDEAAKADRDRYLAEVRAAEPAITDSDNDLLEAIDLGCDIIGLAVDQGDPPDNPDALMATAWAPLDTLDHAEHVLRVGVPIYCPEHADLVASILG